MKKLTRANEGKKICGVCAGLANYLNIDPTVVRLAFAALTLLSGSGIIAYIVAAVIMPVEDGNLVE